MSLAPKYTDPTNPEKPVGKLAPKDAKSFGQLPPPSQEQFKTDSYDTGYVQAYGDRKEYRAEAQSAWQMWRNSAAQAVTGVATDIAKVGGTVGQLANLDAWDSLINDGEVKFSNWFTEAMDSTQEAVREAAPVNETREADKFSPDDVTWWGKNLPSIFSALSFMVPTRAAIGVAGAVGKTLGAGTKFLTSKTGQIVAKGIAGAVFSRYNESMFEAGEQSKIAYNKALEEGSTEEEARMKASDVGSKVWKANMLMMGPDLFQYTQLAGGFKGLGAAGVLLGIAGEGAEEAYQGIVGKEAQGSSFDMKSNYTQHDFFGAGFNQRLNEYIQDPEIQTQAFFGAIGGGVFSAAHGAVDRAYRPKNEKLINEALIKQRAEAIGDKESISKLKNLTLARLAFDHLSAGKIADLKEDLENLKQEPNIDNEVRKGLEENLADVEFIEKQYDKLAGNRNIPQEAIGSLLATQLDFRQTSRSLGELKQKTRTLIGEALSSGEVEGKLSRGKELYHTLQAYDLLQKKTGQNFEKAWSEYNMFFSQEMENFNSNPDNKDKSFFSQILSSSDPEIQDYYNKLVSEQERLNLLREDLATLGTPEGIENFKQLQKTREIEKNGRALLLDEEAKPATIQKALEVIADPELRSDLEKKLATINEAKQDFNKKKTEKIVETAKKKDISKEKLNEVIKKTGGFMKKSDFEPSKQDITDERNPPLPSIKDIDPADLDLVFGPPSGPMDNVQGIEGVEPPQLEVPPGDYGEALSLEVLERLEHEEPAEDTAPTEILSQTKEEELAPTISLESKAAKTVLKEIAGEYKKDKNGEEYFEIEQNPDTTPKKQDYYFAEDFYKKTNPIPVTEVFDVTGETLTVNTPNVNIGQEVIIIKEPQWPFWKSNRPDDVVMNVYAVNENGNRVGKPLTQIPASSNPKTSTEATKELRDRVNKSNKAVRTTIIYKNYGDFINLRNSDGSRLQNSISVLETDMIQTDKGWEVKKTPHNPILAYVDSTGYFRTEHNGMKGISPEVDARIASMDAFIPNEKMLGSVGVLRTDGLGGFTYAMLEPRGLTIEEVDWLKENLAPYLAEKKDADLKTLIHIINGQITEDINNHKDENRLVRLGDDIAFKVTTNKSHYWVKINATGQYADNFDKFMKNQPFMFQAIDENGKKREGIIDSRTLRPEILEDIHKQFNDLLNNQFKNIDKNFLNTEGTYVDIQGNEHKNYYEYLKKTNSLTTDLPEGYSFFNATIYLDTNIKTNSSPVVKDDTKEVVTTSKPEVTQTIVEEKEETEPKKETTKKKVDWKDKAKKGKDKRYRIANAVAPFKSMSQKEIDWMSATFGDEYLSISLGVDRIITFGGLEAFGYYHDAMIKLAQFAEEGSGYHEAFHFVTLTQLTDGQYRKMIEAGKKKFGNKSNLAIEEDLAEDFRKYMLADGNYAVAVEGTRSLFRRILDYIKKALGFKTSIEKLFEDVANFSLSPIARQNIHYRTEHFPRYRLVPGFTLSNEQKEALNASTHRLLQFAMEAAGKDGSYDAILENPKNLQNFIEKLKAEYQAASKEIHKQMDAYEAGTINLTEDQQEELAVKEDLLQTILENWEDKEQEDNVILGYRSAVIQNLANYGFSVKVKKAEIEEDEPKTNTDADEDTIGDEDPSLDVASKERNFGVSFFLNNPLKTLSGKIKRFLATIPEYERDEHGKPRLDKNNKPVIATTIFGTPKFIEFNRIYANLSSKLAGNKNIYTRLTDLAKDDALFAAVKDALDIRIAKGQEGFDSTMAQFYTTFNKANYRFFTTKVGFEDGSPIARVIQSDRRNIENTLIDDWKSSAIRKSLLDSDGKVNIKKAESLLNKLKEAQKDREKQTIDEKKNLVISILNDIGIVLPTQVWEKIDKAKDRKTILDKMLFAEKGPTLEAFLIDAAKGNDPFEGEKGLLKDLATRAKDYVEDLQAKTFINEKNNQVSAINLNTPLTDLISKFTDPTTGRDQIALFENDKFFSDNQFLAHLKDKDRAKNTTVNIFSAFRDGNSEAKEYGDTTSQDSFVSRLTAFHNSGNASGYFYLGTLSDKPQQVSILLPKTQDVNNARAFLKDVFRNTVKNEITRIQRYKANLAGIGNNEGFTVQQVITAKDKDNNKTGDKFHYIPGLNAISGLADSLTKGEISPEDLAAFQPQIDAVIEEFINNEEKLYMNKLIELDLIEDTGKAIKNKNLPEVFNSNVASSLKRFFYNDFAWRTEMSKVLHGDIAFYKNAETYFKRGYQLITPGLQGYYNSELKSAGKKKILNAGIIASSIKEHTAGELLPLAKLIDSSVTFEEVVQGLKDKTHAKRAVHIAVQYAESNKTDAQGYITVEAYRDILISFGQWTDDHEFLYERAWKQGVPVEFVVNNKKFTEEEQKYWKRRAAEIVLQPLKPFYFGNRLIKLSDGSTMLLKEQYKESLIPMLPEWTNKHSQYKELADAMLRDNLDIVHDAEAVKVGSYAVNKDLSQPIVGRPMSTDNLRYPFLVPEKTKEEILAGTQLEKLIVGNIDQQATDKRYILASGKRLTGKEIVQEYHELWASIIKEDYEAFKSLFAIDDTLRVSEGKKLQFLKDLRNVLEEELANRELPGNYLDSLKIIKNKLDQPEFLVGIDFPALGKKYEQILTNLFKKKLLKQKLPGDSLINLADFGTPKTEKSTELNFIRNSEGKIVEAEVGVPRRFARGIKLTKDNTDPETGKIKWESLSEEQKTALQLIIYRIPTQGKNSMIPVRVAFLLPDSSGSVIMVPGEGTKQGGFDFDVDKSYVMKRTLDKGKVEATAANKLFDIHWAILTNNAHAEELLNPLDSRVHDEVIDSYIKKGIISRETKASPFSVATDLDMEKLAKYSKAMIGTFSKFAVAHATYQTIPELIEVKTPIKISHKTYEYNKVGNMRDDTGVLISDNHSAQQNSALDAAKDPKLGYLSITTFNAAVLAYMTELGVNQKLALDFMNQPILKQLYDEYFKNGGNDLKNAISSVLTNNTGLETLMNTAEKKRIHSISPQNLSQSLILPIEENLEHQAQILNDFKQYYYAAQDMSKLNTALSTDTVRDMTSIAAIEGYTDIVEYSTNNKTKVKASPDIFMLSKSPVKRVAAFYNYGIRGALQFTKQFYPYHSPAYEAVRTQIATDNLHKNEKLRNVESIEQVNQAMTIYMLGEDRVFEQTMRKYSPFYESRWDYFTPSKSIGKYLDNLKKDHPKLNKNLFIQALKEEEKFRKNTVQLLGINNTHGNFNKDNLTLAWRDLMQDENKEIRQLAYDLVRFSVQTSGFRITPTGIPIDVIPVEFWRESGLASYHESLVNSYSEGAKTVPSYEAAKVIVRHLYAGTKLVKSVPFKTDKDGNITSDVADIQVPFKGSTHVTEFRATSKSALYNEDSEAKYARYAKMYDKSAGRWRLYEKDNDSQVYKEIQPLGEYGRFVEFTTDGDYYSEHPNNSNLQPAYMKIGPFNIGEKLKGYDDYFDTTLTTTADAVLYKLKDKIKDQTLTKIIDKLLENTDKIANTKITLSLNLLDSYVGAYYPEGNTITIGSASFKDKRTLEHILLHEIIHAYTVGVIRNPNTEVEKNFAQSLQRAWNQAKDTKALKGQYALESVEEFIAELASSTNFRKKLQPGLFQRIIRAIRRLLGLPSTETDLYEKVIEDLYKVLDSSPSLLVRNSEDVSPAFLKAEDDLKKLFEKVIKTLDKKAERQYRTGKDYKTTTAEIEALEQLENKKAVVQYTADRIKEIKELNTEVKKTISDPSQITAKKLRFFKEQLGAYNVLRDIRKHIQQNPAEYSDLKRENGTILDAIDQVLAQVFSLETDIYEASLDVVATWVKNNTQQDLELEDIKERLRVADRDVTTINRGLDAIVNSRDEVLRVIGKTVINQKASAYRKTEQYLKVLAYDANSAYEKWAKEQGIDINDMLERNRPILDPESLKPGTSSIRFIAPDSKEGKKIMSLDLSHPLRFYYVAIVQHYLESQKSIPTHMRPGLRVPSIRRTTMELLGQEKGLNKLRAIKEGVIDSFKRTYDEIDRQATDEAGKALDFVPIRFISLQDGKEGRMSTREVALDVASTVVMFIDEMNNHDAMLEVTADLELAKDVLASREVTKTKKAGWLSSDVKAIVDDNGYVVTTKGEDSNSYKQAKQFIERFVYGKIKQDEGSVKIPLTNQRVDVGKGIDSLLRWTGIRMMAGNLNVAFSNVATGEVTMLKEAFGGRWFNMKDWRYGKKTFLKDSISYMGEFGKRKVESKFGVVFELLNPEDKYRGNLALGKDTSRVRRELDWKNLNIFNSLGTLEMNGSLMLAMLNREKLITPEGTEVGLYDAFEVKNGVAKIKEGYKYKGREFTDQDLNDVRNRIIAVGQKINGIYNTIDGPGIRAYGWGRLLLIMRNWLKPGIDARWRLKYYDERLGQQEEGYYISALNFYKNVFGPEGLMQQNIANLRYVFGVGINNLDFLSQEEREKNSPEQNAELTALRRANVKKFLFEMYTIALLSALAGFGWDDDEKDSFVLYQIVRLKRELSTFFSPTEAWSVLRSPTVTLDTIQRFVQSSYYSSLGLVNGEAYEEYTQGPNKGELKIWANIKNNLPIWSQRNQFVEFDRRIDLIERGWK